MKFNCEICHPIYLSFDERRYLSSDLFVIQIKDSFTCFVRSVIE